MRVFGWVIGAVYFIAVLMFALKNSTPVPVKLTQTIGWNDVPLVMLILGVFVAGVLAGWLAWVPQVLGLKRQIAALDRKSRRLDTLQIAERRTDQLAEAARYAGVVGDLDADTRIPPRKPGPF
jgi:uncharacterized integral membrane protein